LPPYPRSDFTQGLAVNFSIHGKGHNTPPITQKSPCVHGSPSNYERMFRAACAESILQPQNPVPNVGNGKE